MASGQSISFQLLQEYDYQTLAICA